MPNTAHPIPDPRLYPPRKPDNWLLHLAQSVLDASEQQQATLHQQLAQKMTEHLQRRELLPLSVAMVMAPSLSAHQVLWQALRAAVESADTNCSSTLLIALPLVLIGGSTQRTPLPAAITDIASLTGIIWPGDAACWLSDALVHPDALAKMGPDVLHTLTHEPAVARQALSALPGSPAGVDGETVALRFLVGTISPRPLPTQVGDWGMPALQWLTSALRTDGVTLFPLLGAPQPLLQAQVDGLRMLNEAALDMFASRQIRALRQAGHSVAAVMSAHENHDLRFSFSAIEDADSCRGHVWPLSPHDSVEHICEHFVRLLADCQVENTHFLKTIEPDQINGETLFFHANDLSKGDASDAVTAVPGLA